MKNATMSPYARPVPVRRDMIVKTNIDFSSGASWSSPVASLSTISPLTSSAFPSTL